jgi:hypothetical protein
MSQRPSFPGRTVVLPLLATGVIYFGEATYRQTPVAVGVLSVSWTSCVVITADGQIWTVPMGAVDLDEGQTLH